MTMMTRRPSQLGPAGVVAWTPMAYRRLAIVTTAGLVLLTVAGGVVRLTGSGLGCADWPGCSETRFVDVSTGHTAIEQVNRLLSGLIGVPTLALLVVAFARTERGQGLRWPAVATFLSVIANGLVGRFVVSEDLHPAVVQSHFLLAMVAIVFGVVAVVRSGEFRRDGAVRRWSLASGDPGERWRRRLVACLVVVTAGAITTGTVVTGTGPHAGDEDARRFGFDISDVARLHSVTVLVALAVAVALAILATRSGGGTLQQDLSSWLFVAVLQGALGYAQYFTGVPELLVAAHIAGATALWTLTVRLALVQLRVGPTEALHGRTDVADAEALGDAVAGPSGRIAGSPHAAV